MEPRKSYASGGSASPLIGQTIGEYLSFVIARHPEAEAVVSCHQQRRLTYRELGRRSKESHAGCSPSASRKAIGWGFGRPREWSGRCCSSRPRGSARFCQHQPRLPCRRDGVRREPVRIALAGDGAGLQDSDYLARIDEVRTHLPRLERVVVLGERRTGVPGDLLWDETLAAGDSVKAEDVQTRGAAGR